MKKIIVLTLILTQSFISFSQVETEKEELLIEGVPRRSKNAILNYEFYEFLNPKTKSFDTLSAFKNIPWKIKDIYSFLKKKNDFIYIVEKLNLKKNVVESEKLLGLKISNENKVIQSGLYNYTIDKFIRGYGLEYVDIARNSKFRLIERKTLMLTEKSTNKFLKFMPFMPLGIFRVRDETENIKINNHEYKCIQIEGFELDGLAVLNKWKYWMVINEPGLIVKAIMESDTYRYTWLLKEIK